MVSLCGGAALRIPGGTRKAFPFSTTLQDSRPHILQKRPYTCNHASSNYKPHETYYSFVTSAPQELTDKKTLPKIDNGKSDSPRTASVEIVSNSYTVLAEFQSARQTHGSNGEIWQG